MHKPALAQLINSSPTKLLLPTPPKIENFSNKHRISPNHRIHSSKFISQTCTTGIFHRRRRRRPSSPSSSSFFIAVVLHHLSSPSSSLFIAVISQTSIAVVIQHQRLYHSCLHPSISIAVYRHSPSSSPSKLNKQQNEEIKPGEKNHGPRVIAIIQYWNDTNG